MSGQPTPEFKQKPSVNKSIVGIPKKNIRYAFFRTIEAAGQDWESVSRESGDAFLQAPYLQTLETAPPKDFLFGYLVFYVNDIPSGIALCQSRKFRASESLSDLKTQEKEPCFFTGIAKWLKRRVANWMEADILVCGNLVVTGNHSFWFDREKIAIDSIPELLYTALQDAAIQLEKAGTRISIILIKDIAPSDKPFFDAYLQPQQFTPFEIQPNMVLPIGEYKDFEAYLSAMTTKYRTRAKRAFKKGEQLKIKELSRNEIVEATDLMHDLYKSVAKAAGFNVVDLNENYMAVLQKNLEGNFRVFGYFLDDKMISYCTTLKNGKELEAHFLGYEKSLNHDLQLYLNMLYHMIGIAFKSCCTKVVFARTALEIKSSVGAVPEDLWCYLKHTNPLINNFTATALDYFKPVEIWQQRHPFKHLQPAHGEDPEPA